MSGSFKNEDLANIDFRGSSQRAVKAKGPGVTPSRLRASVHECNLVDPLQAVNKYLLVIHSNTLKTPAIVTNIFKEIGRYFDRVFSK